MKNAKPKIIVIVGQTATGKSDYAVSLAKKINGEIVSADSRQVYRGLDIGSGKITQKEMRGIPHYMLDIANPKKVYSVSDYKKDAEKIIDDIVKRGKTPILVGGTGFYIDAITKGQILPEVPPNPKLRKHLYSLSAIALFEYMKKLDPRRAKTIDAKNKVRLVRAIEIATALGKVPKTKPRPKYEVEMIGLTMLDEELKKRIHIRLLARIKEGMIEEIEQLHKNGLSWKRLNELGLEYRYVALYLQKKLTKAEMLEQLEKAIWQYAKRQKTWFKRDGRIRWEEIIVIKF